MDLMSSSEEKLKYPKSIRLIVLNEFCERFNYYGLRTVLVLYLTTVLKFDGDYSTIIYHAFVFMAYFMPLPGAILADSYWGKYNTIMRLSIVYVLGNIFLTGASVADMFTLDVQKTFALLGLFFISVGTGGIKPCVFTFGGDQFQLPEQEKQLLNYCTKFMIAINIGSLISTFLMPEFRHSVHCFGKNTCYPLAFGVPAIIMLTSIVIFISGKNQYIRKKPQYNAISRTFGCIFYALRTKLTSSSSEHTHWLDNAKSVYSENEITETKTALNAITVCTAYPVFWALYEQQGSRWTLQATLMNGYVEFLDWTIKPDQMQFVIPFFGLIFLFLFDAIFYPLLAKVGIYKPLQKLILSGFLAVIAFIIAALLQYKIFGNVTVIPPGKGQLNIYNGFDCKVLMHSSTNMYYIDPLSMSNIKHTNVSQENIVKIKLQFGPECLLVFGNLEFETNVSIIEEQMVSYYLTHSNTNVISLDRIGSYDSLIKEKYGNPKLRLLIDHTFDINDNVTLKGVSENLDTYNLFPLQEQNFKVVKTGKYNVIFNETTILKTVDLKPATFYTLMLQRNAKKMDIELFTVDEGNYIHLLWQLPQFLCMIIADVIFIVTTQEFSFLEAPVTLKSFVSAVNLLTTAIGNLLVVIISSLSIKNQAHEYVLYASLMFFDILLLVYYNFTYKSFGTKKYSETSLNENKNEEITKF